MKSTWTECMIHVFNCLMGPTMIETRMMTLHLQEHQPNSRENEVSEEMDEVSPRPRRIVHPFNRLTYDRLGGVLKELSEAGIVSEYGAHTATNFPVFVCLRWRMLSLFMMICSTRTFLLFLTRLCMLLML